MSVVQEQMVKMLDQKQENNPHTSSTVFGLAEDLKGCDEWKEQLSLLQNRIIQVLSSRELPVAEVSVGETGIHQDRAVILSWSKSQLDRQLAFESNHQRSSDGLLLYCAIRFKDKHDTKVTGSPTKSEIASDSSESGVDLNNDLNNNQSSSEATKLNLSLSDIDQEKEEDEIVSVERDVSEGEDLADSGFRGDDDSEASHEEQPTDEDSKVKKSVRFQDEVEVEQIDRKSNETKVVADESDDAVIEDISGQTQSADTTRGRSSRRELPNQRRSRSLDDHFNGVARKRTNGPRRSRSLSPQYRYVGSVGIFITDDSSLDQSVFKKPPEVRLLARRLRSRATVPKRPIWFVGKADGSFNSKCSKRYIRKHLDESARHYYFYQTLPKIQ